MKIYPLLQLLSLIGLAWARCNHGSLKSSRDSDSITNPTCGQSWKYHPRRLSHHHRKIVAGRNAEPGEFPYQVKLLIKMKLADGEVSEGKCGGVIIDKWHILTAAHCMTQPDIKSPVKNVTALVGAQDLRHQEYTEMAIQRFEVHSKWDYDNLGDVGVDVAMLRTERPLEFKLNSGAWGSVNSICLPGSNEDLAPVGSTVTVSGFGDVAPGKEAEVLQTTEMKVANYMERCEKFKRKSNMGPEHYMCLAPVDNGRNSNACHGDSGGPAATLRDGKWYLVGLTSRGDIRCDSTTCVCKSDSPTTFTRVSALISWIEETKSKMAPARRFSWF